MDLTSLLGSSRITSTDLAPLALSEQLLCILLLESMSPQGLDISNVCGTMVVKQNIFGAIVFKGWRISMRSPSGPFKVIGSKTIHLWLLSSFILLLVTQYYMDIFDIMHERSSLKDGSMSSKSIGPELELWVCFQQATRSTCNLPRGENPITLSTAVVVTEQSGR